MRSILTAGGLLVVTALFAVPVIAEQPTCDPNPLTQTHPGWMKMSSTAVDLRTAPPASATTPLMQDYWRALPAAGAAIDTGRPPVNPLTNRP